MVEEIQGNFTKKIASKRSTHISGIVTEHIQKGQEGALKRLIATVHGAKERVVGNFIVKKLNPLITEKLPEAQGQAVIEKYQWLKNQDYPFPLIPTLRYEETSNSLLMTDITADGSILIDKHTPEDIRNATVISNRDILSTTVQEIAQAAYSHGNGIFLNDDAYAILVNPTTHEGKIMLLDLGVGTFKLDDNRSANVHMPISEERALSMAKNFTSTCIFPEE